MISIWRRASGDRASSRCVNSRGVLTLTAYGGSGVVSIAVAAAMLGRIAVFIVLIRRRFCGSMATAGNSFLTGWRFRCF